MNPKNTHTLPKTSSRKANWSVMQRADDPDIERAHHQLQKDLENGATGVALIFEGANSAYGFGLPALAETIPILFENINLDGIHIRLDNHPHGRLVADSFIDYLQHRRIDPNKTKLTFSTDPTAILATTGKLKMSIEALKASLPQSMSGFFSSGLPGIVLEADSRPYHNAGATPAQEIGAMLSVALGHLRMVEDARHHIVYALPHIGFAMALDQDPITGQAKIQALDYLWRRLQEERGVPSPYQAVIHVETSMRMMTSRDTHNNIIRASTAAHTAISNGATSVSILPHSFVFGLPDSYARRIARNSQLVLIDETVHPITEKSNQPTNDVTALIDASWKEFQRFENEGGVMQSLIDGHLEKRIEESRDLQLIRFHKNERAIIGTSIFSVEEEGPTHITTNQKTSFQAEGIKHCDPLTTGRWDQDLLEAQKRAPIEPVKISE
ncbi:methylmalonyl-CoA mutase family protein [Bartonella tamiae]|uniref:Methylmalonyl-CoA mutase alpha/beta chain catalytic domain-containing protein n=1 Tax=Bartonella tamiae Th239 TaxID=1094558 RepID=J0QWZ3_9HYPH|nr:methylmalonyl-CoA mutase family protein [Bartonella tamiae]EJF90556.1 hypothetical protein ME5_00957 [Bartonella tamiae Th239]EJF94066.1 hypothetical protein MEG_00924 [Bartonella tamiae Th307]